MSDVWDRASEVLTRRAGSIAVIALLLVWLPGVVRGGARLAATPQGLADPAGPGAALVALIGLVAALLAVLGHLTLVALASDPGMSTAAAMRIAVRRFLPYVGVMLPIAAAVLLLMAPIFVAIAAAYPSLAAMRGGTQPPVSPGTAAFVGLYGLVLAVVAIWVEARLLSVLIPVVVNERLGLRSYRRALALTRGLTWRIVGVLLLFAVLVAVSVLAVQGVVGVALRLILGPEHIALVLVLTAAVVALVACAAWAVAAAFSACLYAAAAKARIPA